YLFLMILRPRITTLFPYTTLFRSREQNFWDKARKYDHTREQYEICRYPMSEAELPLAMESYGFRQICTGFVTVNLTPDNPDIPRSEEHTSELQSRFDLVCRLLLEK